MASGIRAVDLFAPVRRGSRQYWPPALKVGQLVIPFALADGLGVALHWIGFADSAHYATGVVVHASRELGVAAEIALTPPGGSPENRREQFAASVAVIGTSGTDTVVACVSAPGHRHDVSLALRALSDMSHVVTTIVIEPLD